MPTSRPPVVLLFCMADRSHFQRVRPVITGLAGRGLAVHVFTASRFADHVVDAGGQFVDLFEGRSVEAADADSWPDPVRYASFAGCYGDAIIREAEALEPCLVLRDTFAVIGQVVARALSVPDVNLCAGHAVVPDRFLAVLDAHPRVTVSSRGRQFVEVLQRRYGLTDASPFSYVTGLSRDLNLYGKPPAFLDPGDRKVFEPVAFYGSLLHAPATLAPADSASPFGADADDCLKVYISFGTLIWHFRLAEAMGAVSAIAQALGRNDGVRTLVGLGGTATDPARAREMEDAGMLVVADVDQARALQQADVFVTHHGLNSTHEAVSHAVPMISYPFVWDQPGLAATCQRLGLAVPMVHEVMGAVTPNDVLTALARVHPLSSPMRTAQARAREWELEVMAARPAVLDQIMALAECSP